MGPEERGAFFGYFEFATQRVHKIASTVVPVGTGLSVSRDEQWLIYTQADQIGSDLMLVENFH
jgi:hypothetical protein